MNIPKLRFKDNNGNDYPQWEKVNLSDICSFLQGLTYTPNDVSNTGILVLRSSNIQNDKISYLDNVFVNINIPDNLFVKENDILMCVRNGSKSLVGKNALITPKDLGNTWGAFMMIVRNKLSNKYVYYYLNTNIFNKHIFKDLGTATINQITKKMLQSFKIYLPQITEQEKISNFLTTVDKKITNLENTITSLENQKKGLLQQIFSQKLRFKDENGNNYPNWEKKKIGLICSISTGKSNTQDKIDNGKYPFYVRSATIERSSKYLYDEEATLTVGDGVSTGKVFHYVNGKYDLHQRCYRMFNFKNTHAKYFYYFFSSHFYNRVKRMSAKNSVDSVRMNMISDMIIDLPCLEEQTKIADFLSAFDRKLDNQKAQLEHWQQIKKGLLQQMFV